MSFNFKQYLLESPQFIVLMSGPLILSWFLLFGIGTTDNSIKNLVMCVVKKLSRESDLFQDLWKTTEIVRKSIFSYICIFQDSIQT